MRDLGVIAILKTGVTPKLSVGDNLTFKNLTYILAKKIVLHKV